MGHLRVTGTTELEQLTCFTASNAAEKMGSQEISKILQVYTGQYTYPDTVEFKNFFFTRMKWMNQLAPFSNTDESTIHARLDALPASMQNNVPTYHAPYPNPWFLEIL